MFGETITKTLLTDGVDEMFHVKGMSYKNDVSFVSTLRAIFERRIPEDEPFNFMYREIAGFRSSEYISEDIVETIEGNGLSNKLWLFNISGTNYNTEVTEIFDETESKVSLCDGHFARIPKVSAFFEKIAEVMCMTSVELKTTVLVVRNLNMCIYHYLQVGCMAYLPWYIAGENREVTALEAAVIGALEGSDVAAYKKAIADIAETFDIRDKRIVAMLKGFESREYRRQVESSTERITRIIQRINELEEQMGGLWSEKCDLDVKILGLQSQIGRDTGDSEIMKYFRGHKNLNLLDVDDSSITFQVKGYLNYFDEDAAKAVISNSDSYFYSTFDLSNEGVTKAEMRLLMEAIYLTQELKLRLCGTYRINMHSNVQAISGADYDDSYNTYMPNVHLDRYSCTGDFGRIFNELIRKNDIIMIVEQCIVSVESMAPTDSAVGSEFTRRLFKRGNPSSRNNVCIELPDGSVVNAKEAIAYLVRKKKAEESQVTDPETGEIICEAAAHTAYRRGGNRGDIETTGEIIYEADEEAEAIPQF